MILFCNIFQEAQCNKPNISMKGGENPKFFLSQVTERPPPIGFPSGVSGRRRDRLFPQNEHFSRSPKGGEIMAVFRIEKTRDYTVMSNHHLRNAGLSLKSKGLLSMMLSLPEDWNYTTRGLAKICKEGTDSIGSALKELERAGYGLSRYGKPGYG